MTPTEAFGNVAASTEKTALIADFDALHSEIATAQTAGAFSSLVQAELQSKVVDLAEQVAANMIDHS